MKIIVFAKNRYKDQFATYGRRKAGILASMNASNTIKQLNYEKYASMQLLINILKNFILQGNEAPDISLPAASVT